MFKGRIADPNSVTVLMDQNLFVHSTAAQVHENITRDIEKIDQQMNDLLGQRLLDAFGDKKLNEEGLEFVEIKEEYTENKTPLRSDVSSKKNVGIGFDSSKMDDFDKKLFELMDTLERNEEETAKKDEIHFEKHVKRVSFSEEVVEFSESNSSTSGESEDDWEDIPQVQIKKKSPVSAQVIENALDNLSDSDFEDFLTGKTVSQEYHKKRDVIRSGSNQIEYPTEEIDSEIIEYVNASYKQSDEPPQVVIKAQTRFQPKVHFKPNVIKKKPIEEKISELDINEEKPKVSRFKQERINKK